MNASYDPAQDENIAFYLSDMGNGAAGPAIRTPPNPAYDVEALLTNYRSFLMNRCRMLTHGNRHDANDLFSRVVLKVYSEQPDQLQRIRYVGGWLSTVAYNLFIDEQRERQASARRDENLGYFYEILGVESASPEQILLNKELGRHLYLAFAALPTRLRPAAHMRFHEEAPYEEIAATLCISQANARKHIQEARKILAARLRVYADAARHGAVAAKRPCAMAHAGYDRPGAGKAENFTARCAATS